MSLETTINEAVKEAMKAKNKVALDSLRAVKSQILLLKTESKDAQVSEKEEIALLQRLIKQRKEAAEQFQNNNRPELAEKELLQAEVISQFLPAQLSEKELDDALETIISQTGASSMKDMGKVMGIANQQLMGKADGKTIATKVKQLLG